LAHPGRLQRRSISGSFLGVQLPCVRSRRTGKS
jgi:hypothetical protein